MKRYRRFRLVPVDQPRIARVRLGAVDYRPLMVGLPGHKPISTWTGKRVSFRRQSRRRSQFESIRPSQCRGTIALQLPFRTVFHQFRPERIQAALGRLCGVDGTAAVLQEVALTNFRLAKPQQVFETDDVADLKLPN